MRGFTLIETLVYIGLFSILMVGALIGAFELAQSGPHNETAVALQEEGTFILRKLNWAFTGATSTTYSNGTLTVWRLPGESFPDTDNPLAFSVASGTLFLARSVYAPVALTGAAFTVSAFTATTTATYPVEADVSFVLSSLGANAQTAPFTYRTYLR